MKIQSLALKEAHKIRRSMLRLGEDWAWSRCMKYGWNKAKGKKKLKKGN